MYLYWFSPTELQDTRTKFSSKKFDAAPGAERKSEGIF